MSSREKRQPKSQDASCLGSKLVRRGEETRGLSCGNCPGSKGGEFSYRRGYQPRAKEQTSTFGDDGWEIFYYPRRPHPAGARGRPRPSRPSCCHTATPLKTQDSTSRTTRAQVSNDRETSAYQGQETSKPQPNQCKYTTKRSKMSLTNSLKRGKQKKSASFDAQKKTEKCQKNG